MIYIPPSWWHHIEALDGNVSMLLPFDMSRAEQVALIIPVVLELAETKVCVCWTAKKSKRDLWDLWA